MLQKLRKGKSEISTLLRVGISALLCFTALAAGGVSFVVLAAMKKEPASRPKIPHIYNVEVFHARREPELQEIVTGFGTAQADREVVLKAEVSGRVIETPVNLKVGQKVYPTGESAGSTSHLLVCIEKEVYFRKVEKIQALIEQNDEELAGLRQEYLNNENLLKNAQENKKTYKENYDRILDARRKNAVNESEVIQARLELQRYQDAITQAENSQKLFPTRRSVIEKTKKTRQSDLKIAQLDFQHCDIAAPFEGYISETMVEKGQFVRTGDQLLRITDSSVVEIPVGIPVDEYDAIRTDIENSLSSAESRPILVRIANNETSETIRVGYLARVAPKAEESTRTVELFVRVSNNLANLYKQEKRTKILPGRFVHVRIDGPVHRNILVVPRDAIVKNRVFVATNIKPVQDESDIFEATVEEKEITIDKKFNALASIQSGIESKDIIILTNLDVISHGVKIRFKGKRVRNLDQELESGFSRLVRPQRNVSINPSRRISN